MKSGSLLLSIVSFATLLPAFFLGAQVGHTGALAPESRRAVSAARGPKSASVAFGTLRALANPDSAEWLKTLAEQGLSPWEGHEHFWHLVAADGEVRALWLFRKDNVSSYVYLLFFPLAKTPVGEATLSWLYRSATSYSFQDGTWVELTFPGAAGIWGGSVSQTFLIDLTSSVLIRNSLMITWKP